MMLLRSISLYLAFHPVSSFFLSALSHVSPLSVCLSFQLTMRARDGGREVDDQVERKDGDLEGVRYFFVPLSLSCFLSSLFACLT